MSEMSEFYAFARDFFGLRGTKAKPVSNPYARLIFRAGPIAAPMDQVKARQLGANSVELKIGEWSGVMKRL